MDFNISNFFDNRSKRSKIGDFQDLDHLDGLSISTVNAGLYKKEMILFYFILEKVSHAQFLLNQKLYRKI